MRPEPTNPFHIARAYQVQPPAARSANPAPRPESTNPVAGSIKPVAPSSRIVAAIVPGRVSFAGAAPAQVQTALPFYTHPADKNAAATAVTAGRTLDVQG
jgi:hypothetical protein